MPLLASAPIQVPFDLLCCLCRVKGRSVNEVLTIKNSDIAKHLSLPPVKLHCSMPRGPRLLQHSLLRSCRLQQLEAWLRTFCTVCPF